MSALPAGPAATKARYERERAALIEDVAFMAEHGETLAGAARRLGRSAEALSRTLRQHAPEVHARLLTNAEREAA